MLHQQAELKRLQRELAKTKKKEAASSGEPHPLFSILFVFSLLLLFISPFRCHRLFYRRVSTISLCSSVWRGLSLSLFVSVSIPLSLLFGYLLHFRSPLLPISLYVCSFTLYPFSRIFFSLSLSLFLSIHHRSSSPEYSLPTQLASSGHPQPQRRPPMSLALPSTARRMAL